ncbi:CU044_2847 family protein [Streptomyces sp. JJ36]|uniref:CU044_2847 family protein n=1 Tax=Streptomyces sp. JJ36 TaxID=2736645 RepID=UPI001F3EABEF|nr:CU044_2847 family protein [Streptomyces sp. JJ36]MCF6522733.1 hypothetical protein [Streptomyces sp. JJ36]
MYVVDVPTGDGAGRLLIEVRDVDEGLVDVARPGQVVARSARSLQEMLQSVRPVAASFVDNFSRLPQAPDEITVSFGISLDAKADAVITSTSAAANFSVSLTWHPSGRGGDTVPPQASGPAGGAGSTSPAGS